MSDIELRPCPFCGRSGAILDEPLNEDEYGCFCNAHCGAIGPCDEDGEKAMEFWNTRPLEDAANARAEAAEAQVAALQAALDAAINMNIEKNAEVVRLTAALEEANSALISMVYQYCYRPLDANKEPAIDIYQHDFMSAGEEAFAYLVEHGLAKWTDESHYAILINSKTSLSVKSDD